MSPLHREFNFWFAKLSKPSFMIDVLVSYLRGVMVWLLRFGLVHVCSGTCTPTPDNHEITTHTMQINASWTFPFVLVDLLFSAQLYDTEHTHGILGEKAVCTGGFGRGIIPGLWFRNSAAVTKDDCSWTEIWVFFCKTRVISMREPWHETSRTVDASAWHDLTHAPYQPLLYQGYCILVKNSVWFIRKIPIKQVPNNTVSHFPETFKRRYSDPWLRWFSWAKHSVGVFTRDDIQSTIHWQLSLCLAIIMQNTSSIFDSYHIIGLQDNTSQSSIHSASLPSGFFPPSPSHRHAGSEPFNGVRSTPPLPDGADAPVDFITL